MFLLSKVLLPKDEVIKKSSFYNWGTKMENQFFVWVIALHCISFLYTFSQGENNMVCLCEPIMNLFVQSLLYFMWDLNNHMRTSPLSSSSLGN